MPMESIKKSLLKTISWRIVAVILTSGIIYFFTGTISESLEISITANVASMIAFYLHERIWARYK